MAKGASDDRSRTESAWPNRDGTPTDGDVDPGDRIPDGLWGRRRSVRRRRARPRATTPAATPGSSAMPTATAPEASASPPPLPGGRLVYIALNEDGVGSLVATNPDGTDTTPLLPGDNPPRWSPDGRHISVVANDADDHLFVGLVDPDGSNYVQFDNPDPTLELDCHAWSPDGLRLACSGFDGTDVTPERDLHRALIRWRRPHPRDDQPRWRS